MNNSTCKFSLSQEGLFLLEQSRKTRICNFIHIKSIIIDKVTDIETYELEYRRRNTNELNTRIIKSEDIQKNNILSLSKYGVDINDNNKSLVSEYLSTSLQTAPIKITLNGYGWIQYKSQKLFIGDTILSAAPTKESLINNAKKLDLAPHGYIEDWLNLYNEYILGNAYLELAVVFGLSAPILNYLSESYPDLTTILIHISGDSTAGKSTASMLAVSTAGNPNQISSKSLMRKWSGTENSIMAILEDISGVPIAFDELSSFRGDNLTALVYTLTDGVGKARAKIDGSLTEPKNWNTIILSNGEASILTKLNNNTGLKARAFEFNNITWTVSAEQAEIIKEVCCNNYGHILPLFVRNLFTYGTDKIIEVFEEEKQLLIEKFPNSRLKDRIVAKFAVFTTTARLLKETGTLDINLDTVFELLYEKELSAITNREIGIIAYEKLLQYLLANRAKLGYNAYKQIGSLKNDSIFIIREELGAILKELRFEDPAIIIKDWSKRDYLITPEGDRKITRKQENNKTLIGYTIKISEEYKPHFFPSTT
ncbi:DUF927 domain-containing protein [Gemella morbillorum]